MSSRYLTFIPIRPTVPDMAIPTAPKGKLPPFRAAAHSKDPGTKKLARTRTRMKARLGRKR